MRKEPLVSFKECRRSLALGAPLLVGQLAEIGMSVCDTIMSGRHGAGTLAAVGVACSVWWPITLFALGLLQAMSGMTAQLAGARRPDEAVRLLRHGLVLALALALLLDAVLFGISCCMGIFGIPEAMLPAASGYLRALLPGLPALLVFTVLRSFAEGFGYTRPGMLVAMVCLAVNIPGNWIFINGHLGLPELGAIGCGIASSLCWLLMVLCMGAWLRHSQSFSDVRPLGGGKRAILHDATTVSPAPVAFEFAIIRRIVRIGLPIACSFCIETMLYAVTAILLAPAGEIAVAAHQVTMGWSNVVFAVPLAISMTATILVGQHLGAGRHARARTAARTVALMSLTGALFVIAITIALRFPLARLCGANEEVLPVVGTLMLLCAGYQLSDSVQSVCCGIMRGYSDTRSISIVSVLAYGCIGIPVGYVLAMTDWLFPAMGAAGFWWGYIVALSFSAACYFCRVRHLHRLSDAAVHTLITR